MKNQNSLYATVFTITVVVAVVFLGATKANNARSTMDTLQRHQVPQLRYLEQMRLG